MFSGSSVVDDENASTLLELQVDCGADIRLVKPGDDGITITVVQGVRVLSGGGPEETIQGLPVELGLQKSGNSWGAQGEVDADYWDFSGQAGATGPQKIARWSRR